MSDIEEKRVYEDRRPETVLAVASEQGLATVRTSGDQVGRFGIARRCRARDVAAAGGRVSVATDEGVLAAAGEAARAGEDAFEPLGFDGGAVAVAVGAAEREAGAADDTTDADPVDDDVLAANDGLLAADESGGVFRYDGGDGEWATLGTVPSVRALAGDLVAASDGVYRVDGEDLRPVGLDDVRDVAAAGAPLAATADGLYRLGPGWVRDREGAFETVAAAADDTRRAHAATAERLYERTDGEWEPVDLPVAEAVADVAYGECVYAVTASGTVLVEADPERTADGTGGWRSRALGLPDVCALAVVP